MHVSYPKGMFGVVLPPNVVGQPCHLGNVSQVKFPSSIMGGPGGYTDAQLRKIHAHLRIDDAAFEDIMALLEQTLLRLRSLRLVRDAAEIEREAKRSPLGDQ